VPSTTLVRQVVEYLKLHDRTFIVVADDHKVAGLIGRDKLLIKVGSSESSLYAQQPIAVVMDATPLIFEGSGDVSQLFRHVVSRPIETVYDDIVISTNGVFAGLLSVRKLMECMLEELEYQRSITMETFSTLKKPIVATFFDQKHTAGFAATSIDPYAYTMAISKDDATPIKLRGHLDAFSVIELMQMLVQGTKTGRLDLCGKAKKATCFTVFFDQGKIIHAEGMSETGKNALWKALKFTDGDFSFHPGLLHPARSIHEDPMFLLMEACRLQDEAAYGVTR
jgi:CBS domain-containing protein